MQMPWEIVVGVVRRSRQPMRRRRVSLNFAPMRSPIRILGIDPGLRRTGWGLIESDGNRLVYVACGSVETSERAALGVRLVALHDGLAEVIASFSPRIFAQGTFPDTVQV